MTGLEFIENQKKKKCKLQHIVLISGGWTEERRNRAHDLGCLTLDKPFRFDQLFELLDGIELSIDPTRELRDWLIGAGTPPE